MSEVNAEDGCSAAGGGERTGINFLVVPAKAGIGA